MQPTKVKIGDSDATYRSEKLEILMLPTEVKIGDSDATYRSENWRF